MEQPISGDTNELLQTAVAGRYTLERELGRGGMGIVYLAHDIALDRRVAIKLLPPELAVQPVLRERFLREARLAARLSHPHVVPVYAVEHHGAAVFFVMGFVDGESLAARLGRIGALPPAEVTRVVQEVAWALAYAHGRGVVHRDVKPDNILLETGSGRAVVADFGIARAIEGSASHAAENAPGSPALTQVGETLGTASYMSPEQAAGETLDGRSDLYSLGVVAFQAVTGRLPFVASNTATLLGMHLTRPAPPVASVRPGIPGALAMVIDRSLAKLPEERFATGEAMADALGHVADRHVAPPLRNFLRAAEQGTSSAILVLFLLGVVGVFDSGERSLLAFLAFGGVIGAFADLFVRTQRAASYRLPLRRRSGGDHAGGA